MLGASSAGPPPRTWTGHKGSYAYKIILDHFLSCVSLTLSYPLPPLPAKEQPQESSYTPRGEGKGSNSIANKYKPMES